ncbi:MAG: helix-turn-helix transcriptional regulator [Desulfobacterales bacterium]|nr:helix-turn-helix transcriptional regulator [Desulfobacterales bacterium]
MNVEFESLYKILKHPIRRRVVLELDKKGELAYVELMTLLEVENTGKLNYHLKILGDLIEKNPDGKYHLTEKGDLASQLLHKFPEKEFKPSPLGGGDAILIGSIGFVLALCNPGLWILPILGLVPAGLVFGVLGLFYALIIPSGTMWYLTVKRTRSNDLYNLFKPPLVTSALFTLLVVTMYLLDIRLAFTFAEQERMLILSTPAYMISNISFSFLGVGIAEIVYRAKTQGVFNIELDRLG